MKNPVKRRSFLALLLALVMVFSTFITACGDDKNDGQSSQSSSSSSSAGGEWVMPDDEYQLSIGKGERQLTIYYNRSAGYSDCDIWLWHADAVGRGYELHECGYGAKMVINLPDHITEVGFIIRTGCSDPCGETWGTATKDGTNDDRKIFLDGESTVVYTKAGDPKAYSSVDGGKTLKEIKFINLADLQNETTVKYVLSGAHKILHESQVSIKDNDGNDVPLKSITSVGANVSNGVITTKNPLDITKSYTLNIEGFDPAAIVPNTYFSSAAFKAAYEYDGELGVKIADGATLFKLWAPTASKVVLNLFNSGNEGTAYAKIDLVKGEKGVWSYTANENLSGKYYTYSVTASMGEQEAVDPYAVSAGLNGNRGMIIDLDTTDPDGWMDEVFNNEKITNYTDASIWEVQIRDFSNKLDGSKYKGKYLAFTETGLKNAAGLPVGLDYLKDLGITHVHLMPTYDYATVDEATLDGYNWGYDPKNYNVPEGGYSTDPYHGEVRVREFKQMVQALHANGISVVMDVVYNHTYDLNSNLNKVVPNYYYRYQANGAPSNGSGCGNETASDRQMFRKYMIDSVTHWMKEYSIDGFRFDLMGLHDIETMQQIEQAVHAINPKALIYGEGWTGGGSALGGDKQATLSNIQKLNSNVRTNGVAMFNDVLRDAIKGSTNGQDTGFATGARGNLASKVMFGVVGSTNNTSFSGHTNSWNAHNPTNVINYASAHDNLSLWDKICWAYGEDELSLDLRLRRNRLSAAIVQTSLGIPFMQAGEELLRAKKNEDGSYNENSYNSSDEVNNLRWDFTANSPQYQMSQYYKGLIEFRQANATLRLPVAEDRGQKICVRDGQTRDTLIAFVMNNIYTGEKLFIIYNAGVSDVTVSLPSGSWDMYISGNRAGATPIQEGMSGSFTAEKISAYVFKLSA